MKTIGIIGGMSAESSALYYRRLNQETRRRLGGLHSAELLMWSVDFAPVAQMQAWGAWGDAGIRLGAIARKLEAAGAEILLLATNTMHKVAPAIESAVTIPFLHIADTTAARIVEVGYRRPGLMATRFTMADDFYTGRLIERFGLDPLVPEGDDLDDTHRIIYDELCQGIVTDESRARYVAIAEQLVRRGADCLILGCTEVGMLLGQHNVSVPVFDTTLIHCDAALDLALAADEAPHSTPQAATGTHG